MNRYIFIIILLICQSQKLLSQNYGFAIIQDKDGFANIRYSPNLKAEVTGKVINKEVVFALDNNDVKDWYEVEINLKNGFIHKSRLKFITTFTDIPVSIKKENYLKFGNQYASLEIIANKFALKANTVQNLKMVII
jgi:uncharacterized protein YgiM (DUF1202 family)